MNLTNTPRPMGRRAALGLGGLTVAGLAGLSMGSAQASGPVGDETPIGKTATAACVDEASLPYQSAINGAALWYEITSEPAKFRFDTVMFDRLKAWQKFWEDNTPYAAMDRIDSYGAYVNRNDDCSSMHSVGRAFDIASAWSGAGRHFSARYDLWKGWTGADLTNVRKQYWAAGASLHLHFQHTLTYLYNAPHHTHFHVDNAKSGSGLSSLSTSSGTQVQSIQAMLNYVWGKGTGIDGKFGPETTRHSSEVLATIGKGGTLSSSQGHWHAFLTATTRKGSGAQNY